LVDLHHSASSASRHRLLLDLLSPAILFHVFFNLELLGNLGIVSGVLIEALAKSLHPAVVLLPQPEITGQVLLRLRLFLWPPTKGTAAEKVPARNDIGWALFLFTLCSILLACHGSGHSGASF